MKRHQPRTYALAPPDAATPVLQTLKPEFLSFTIDTSLLLGGHWWGPAKSMKNGVATDLVAPLDLENEKLVAFARALAPAMLRIGGTEADHVRYKPGRKAAGARGLAYHEEPDDPESPPADPGRHRYKLGKGVWKRVHRFCDRTRCSLLFTVSAGPADRDADGAWLETNLNKLAAHSLSRNLRVGAWELGNEVNGFPFVYGLKHRVSAGQYARDFARFGSLLKGLAPDAFLVGPASAVWPRIGEPNPLIRGFCAGPAAGFLDALSWHYYPQQSSHGRVATRRAGPAVLLSPRALDEVRRHNRAVRKALDAANRSRPRHRRTENWMTETAHALYGGEEGLSDGFVSTLWWLDELGVLAQEGVQRVFRQSLIGARYGLLDQDSFAPRPDFYASLIWKRVMGREVLDPGPLVAPDRRLRVYLHRGLSRTRSEKAGSPALSLLAVNIHPTSGAALVVDPGLLALRERYLLAGDGGFVASRLLINGVAGETDFIDAWSSRRTARKYRARTFTDAEKAGKLELAPLSALVVRWKELTPPGSAPAT